MNRYLALTQSEISLYNEEVARLTPHEGTEVMALTNEWAAERVNRLEVRMLEHRFGPISPELRTAVEQLSFDALDGLATAILDFKSLAEAEAWIARHQQDPSSAT